MNSSGIRFWIGAILFLAAALLMTQLIGNQYPFFACYVILQFIVLAVAWSILGGYAGYVNFGTSAFFGVGVYTAVFLFKAAGERMRGVDVSGVAGACFLAAVMALVMLSAPVVLTLREDHLVMALDGASRKLVA